jgi:hypothetical protein
LYTTTDLSLTASYRLAYPPSASGRKPATEWRAASRALRARGVVRALERAALLDPRRMKEEALVALGRITRGELDPSYSPSALARLREGDRVLRQGAARARTMERDREQRQQQEAWSMFAKAAVSLYKSRRNGRPPLSREEQTQLIFDHYRPIAPPELLAAPPPAEPDDPHMTAMLKHVRSRQRALDAERVPTPPTAELCPEPGGCFPQPVDSSGGAPIAIAALHSATGPPPEPAGEWILEPVPGRHPPVRRRRWVPAAEGLGGSQ